MAVNDQKITDDYAIYHGDCCEVMPSLPSGSVHMSLYSPPFGGMLYQYSSDAADLSNSLDGATTARSMHARGLYDADTNVFSAYKIGVYLLEP